MTDNTGEPDELVIIVGSDDRYAIGLAVTLHSTLSRLDCDQAVQVIVVDGGIVPSSRRRLERVIDTTRPATSAGRSEIITGLVILPFPDGARLVLGRR